MKNDGHTEPQLVPKLLLQVSVREVRNSLVGDPIDGGLKESIDSENNTIIISDSKSRSLLPPQLKKCHQYTRSCVVANVAYLPKVYIHNYCHVEIVILKKSRISAKILKIEGLGGNKNAYMKHIKIQSCHMGLIFTPEYLIWKSKKCVRIHSQIMHYHTGNVVMHDLTVYTQTLFTFPYQILWCKYKSHVT